MRLLRCNVESREVAELGRRSQEQNKATEGETHAGTAETGENAVWAGPRQVGTPCHPQMSACSGGQRPPPAELGSPRTGRAGQRPLSVEFGSSNHRPMRASSGPEQPRVGGPVRGGAVAAERVAAAVRLTGRRVGAKDC